MQIRHKHSALTIIAGALSAALMPVESMQPSAWAAEHLVLPDGPSAGQLWSAEKTPYIIEPLDIFDPDNPVNEVAIMKSAQTGFSTLLIAGAGYIIDQNPCRAMLIQPTENALQDFRSEKLDVTIRQSPCLASKVSRQSTKTESGSRARVKNFPKGSLALSVASSSRDLRSKTIQFALCDEIDEYPADLDKQGAPLDMIAARQTAFLATGDWKRFKVSTPTIKGESAIEDSYNAGDQRRWHVTCPHCAEKFVFEFDLKRFQFEPEYPYTVTYFAPCCGGEIKSHQKYSLVQNGEWIATNPKPGAPRSYHFDALSSPFVLWEHIARAYVEADGDPAKLKTFHNLMLGLPYEVNGDAPDHERLYELRENYPRGVIPAKGLLFTIAADVQKSGIWWEAVAWAPDRQSWCVDTGFIEGETNDPRKGAFQKLAELYEKDWPDSFGSTRRADAFGVDSGYRSSVVYNWCRARQNTYALDGRDGWGHPSIGLPKKVDINFKGEKRIRRGARLWPVGTWPLKAAHYDDLRKEGLKSGAEKDPSGYCHFGTFLDLSYFQQITSEYLAEEKISGQIKRRWKIAGFNTENHLLDCRIYNRALAEHLGLLSLSDDQWKELAALRGLNQDQARDLFAAEPVKIASSAPTPEQKTEIVKNTGATPKSTHRPIGPRRAGRTRRF